jgi:hypothetical protein
MNIEIHIKELVLNGFAPDDRYHVSKSIERELTKLFAEQGVPPLFVHGGAITNLDGGSFDMVNGSTSEYIGARVARALYGGFNR